MNISMKDNTELHNGHQEYAISLYLDLMKKCLTDLIYAQQHEQFNLQGQPYNEDRKSMAWNGRFAPIP